MHNVLTLSFIKKKQLGSTNKKAIRINICVYENGHHADSFLENAPFELLEHG